MKETKAIERFAKLAGKLIAKIIYCYATVAIKGLFVISEKLISYFRFFSKIQRLLFADTIWNVLLRRLPKFQRTNGFVRRVVYATKGAVNKSFFDLLCCYFIFLCKFDILFVFFFALL